MKKITSKINWMAEKFNNFNEEFMKNKDFWITLAQALFVTSVCMFTFYLAAVLQGGAQ